jgi:hypothetical protein
MEIENRRLREEADRRLSGWVYTCLFRTARGTGQESAGALSGYRRGVKSWKPSAKFGRSAAHGINPELMRWESAQTQVWPEVESRRGLARLPAAGPKPLV